MSSVWRSGWVRHVGVLVLAVGVAAGCESGSTDPDGGEDPGDATIVATVTTDGAAESGVSVELYAAGGTSSLQAATTDGSGEATFTMLDAGDYEVEVEVPTDLSVVAGGDDRKPVTVAESGQETVSFSLTAESQTAPTDTVEVEAVNFSFTPSQLTIAPNTLVRWVNTTSTLHTVTPDGHSEWTDTSLPGNGDTFEHVFTTEGTFPYYCTPHRSSGMTGTVTVEAQ